ncbi:MAG: helix-turn-helix domain-containing protein [candidate division Zixibacteria bacterium]|nr:helix-turn-helix domain-containing protein [candidate division Zixibacteria bacterium]
MKVGKKKTSDTMAILKHKYYRAKPERASALEQEPLNAGIARKIYALRTRSGLTQAQLANKIGTTASVISRLEGSDYDGHSLNILRRIASVMGMTLEVRFRANVSAARGKQSPNRKLNGLNNSRRVDV